MLNQVFFVVGIIDTVMILLIGIAGAIIIILGRDMNAYMERVVPACAVLICTSIAAGIAMIITRWISGT